jgi:hypothetical protein
VPEPTKDRATRRRLTNGWVIARAQSHLRISRTPEIAPDAGSELAERTAAVLRAYRELT